MASQIIVVILIILTDWLYKYSHEHPSQPVIKGLRRYGWLILLLCFASIIKIQTKHLFSAISLRVFVLMIVIMFLVFRSMRKNNN